MNENRVWAVLFQLHITNTSAKFQPLLFCLLDSNGDFLVERPISWPPNDHSDHKVRLLMAHPESISESIKRATKGGFFFNFLIIFCSRFYKIPFYNNVVLVWGSFITKLQRCSSNLKKNIFTVKPSRLQVWITSLHSNTNLYVTVSVSLSLSLFITACPMSSSFNKHLTKRLEKKHKTFGKQQVNLLRYNYQSLCHMISYTGRHREENISRHNSQSILDKLLKRPKDSRYSNVCPQNIRLKSARMRNFF